jgi:GTP-binding protein
MKLRPIVVLNKCDKDDAWTRIENGEVEMELLETFDSLGADEDQMDYVTVYSSGKAGWATTDIDVARKLATGHSSGLDEGTSMKVLLDSILMNIPPPKISSIESDSEEEQFALAATTVGYDNFLGRLCTGRIYKGSIQKNDNVVAIPRDYESGNLATSTITGVFVNRGVNRTELDPPIASAGDIITLSGVPDSIKVGDTLCLKSNPLSKPIETPPITPPTLSMEIGANTSPFQGKEGTIVASSRIRERLISETDNNVTLTVSKSDTDSERSVVHARGELQLGILIEEMRREGYELTVSPPKIITSTCEMTGKKLEPYEEVTIDVDTEYSGAVMNSLTSSRKGILLSMSDSSDGKTRLVFEVPSRGLLGFQSEIATVTRGTAVVNHLFLENREYVGHIGGVDKGKLVSSDTGKVALYALANIAKRGELFVKPGDEVYPGMVIGEHAKAGDLEVNAVRAKEASNIRTVNKDEKLYVPPPKLMSIEELIGYMNDDEVIEVTPKSVRLRKAELDSGVRERLARTRKKQMMAAQQNKNK